MVRVCEICGKEYTKVVGVSFAKYCSEGCRKEAARRRYTPVGKAVKRCPTCGNEFAAINKNQVYCCGKCRPSIKDIRRNRKRPKNHRYVCKHCGKEFFGGVTREKHKHLFCSRACASRWKASMSSHTFRVVGGSGFVLNTCKKCGKDFLSLKRQTYCSNECEYAEILARSRERQREKRNAVYSKQVRFCKHCGKMFTPTIKKSKVYCSDDCRRKHNNLMIREKSKLRLKGKIVDRGISLKKLILRDRGVCCLCGGKVDETDYMIKDGAFVVGKNYPSIDHIIPLSKGGLHKWENVQLAHFICNSIKGAGGRDSVH